MNPTLHKGLYDQRVARRVYLVAQLTAEHTELITKLQDSTPDVVNNCAAHAIMLTGIRMKDLKSRIDSVDGEIHILEMAAPSAE